MSDTTTDPRVIPVTAGLMPADGMRHHTLHWVWRNNAFTVWTWMGTGWRWVDPTKPAAEQVDGYNDPAVAYADGWRYVCPAIPPGAVVPR